MSNFVSIKSTIPQLAPSFIQEDHPIFIQFVEAYFEYLERTDGPIDFVRNAISRIDPSVAMNEFITQFFEEMKLIPNSAVADKNLLAQHIYDLYQSKGTIKSFELFFRLMFNEDVKIYFPKDDLLRVSDGKWNRNIKIRCTIIDGDIYSIIGNRITQYSDIGEIVASANVESVQGLSQTSYYDIFLNPDSIIGNFSAGLELVFGGIRLFPELAPKFNTSAGRGSGYSAGDRISTYQGENVSARVDSVLSGGIDSVIILNGGVGHSIGDKFSVISTSGSGADIRVSNVQAGVVTEVNVVSKGQGFNTFPTLELSSGTFIGVGSKIGAIGNFKIEDPGFAHSTPPEVSVDTTAVIVDSPPFISGENLTILSERLIAENGDEILQEDSFVISTEDQSSELFDVSIIPVTDNVVKIKGIIQKLSISTEDLFFVLLEDGGSLLSEKSSGAIFQRTIVGNQSGSKSRIMYINPANIDNDLSAVYDAGSNFITVDGNISEITKRIQDSRYYQEFSYVIKSAQSISSYRNAIYSLLHPAGLAIFGSIDIESKITLIVTAFNGIGSIVSKIIESYIQLESVLNKSITTIISQVSIPTNNLHDYEWIEQYKFAMSPRGSIFAGTKLTNTRYISTPVTDTTLQIKDVGHLKFNNFYKYDFESQLYVAPGYVDDGYIGTMSIGPDDYFNTIYTTDYYSIKIGKLNIGWDSDISTVAWFGLSTENGEELMTEDSLFQLTT